MNVVVHIPHRGTELESNALSLAQRAPTFTMEWVNKERVSIAIFSSLPTGIDLALELIGTAIFLEGAWASVKSKPISSLTKLWQRLDCYRGSLETAYPNRYCHEKSALFNTLVECEQHLCPVSCQFVCTPCMRMTQEGSEVSMIQRYEMAVALAEIDWCPNLHLPSKEEEPLGAPFVRLKPFSANP